VGVEDGADRDALRALVERWAQEHRHRVAALPGVSVGHAGGSVVASSLAEVLQAFRLFSPLAALVTRRG
jgi:hypothetical protein